MFEQLRAGVKEAAVDAARKSILSVVAGVLFAVGIAFLTVAVWIYISHESNTLTAALAIALIYLLTGVIVLLVGWSRDRRPHPIHQPQSGTMGARAYNAPPSGPGAASQPSFASNQSVLPALMESFFFGLDSAMRARRDPPPPGSPPPRDRY